MKWLGLKKCLKIFTREESSILLSGFSQHALYSGLRVTKICGLFAALFAALFFGLFTGSFASAASIYDDVIQPTDNLIVHYNRYGNESIDVSTSYAGYVSDCSPDFQASLNTAFDTGAWGVYQLNSRISSYAYREVALFWHETNTTPSLTWSSGSLQLNYASNSRSVRLTQNSSGNLVVSCSNPPGSSGYQIASNSMTADNFYNAQPFLYTGVIDYPAGYEGQQIPTDTGDNKPTIRPDFTYTVTDRDIQAKDYKKDLPEFVPDEGYTFNGYEVEWSLFKNSELINHQILLQEKDYKYKVDDYGDYRLEARYLVQQCVRYEGYPETPDYCFYVDLGTEFEDVDFTSTAVNLKIDGSSSSGNTLLLECDVAGVCSLPDKTPASLFFGSLDNLNTHGLTQFFTAPITFLGTLPSKAENCSPITFPLMGQTISLECLKSRYYDWSTTVMNIYTTLIIAGTGYLIAFNLFRHIKDINTPDKDKIEVARL